MMRIMIYKITAFVEFGAGIALIISIIFSSMDNGTCAGCYYRKSHPIDC